MEQFHLLLLLVVVVAAFLSTLCRGCDLDNIRQNAASHLTGGWTALPEDNAAVLQLRGAAVAFNNSQTISKALQVTEAYSQVVAGINYCIRFNAAGDCSHGRTHCQSLECVVEGHKPLQTGGITGLVSPTKVNCKQLDACDIDSVRQNATMSKLGGWTDVTAANSAPIDRLHGAASQVAGVHRGRIIEAYSQMVSGFNYCIRFESNGLEGCQSSCPSLTCVAGGFKPLPLNESSSLLIMHIGVKCHDATVLRASSAGTRTVTSFVTSTFVVLVGAFVAAC